MKKKIIYIFYLPLTQKLNSDYYIDEVAKNDFHTEYWDITKIYCKNFNLVDTLERNYIRKFENYRQLEESIKLEDISNCIFIVDPPYEGRSLKLYRILTKCKAKTCYFLRGVNPLPKESLLKRFITKPSLVFNPLKMNEFLSNRIAKFYLKTGLVKNYDIVFTAGEIAANMFNGVSQVKRINLSDYNEFLASQGNSTKIVENKYCVFLDDYLPFHPDCAFTHNPKIDDKKYYQSLNNFFKLIESKYKIDVVIAAHPKSDYKPDFFNGRKIIKNKTNLLVKDSEFVIATASTSISYAVLHLKPIIFIITDEIKTKYSHTSYGKLPSVSSKFLGCNLYNIDSISNQDEFCYNSVNAEQYDCFKYNYLTTRETKDKSTKDIYLEFLNTAGN